MGVKNLTIAQLVPDFRLHALQKFKGFPPHRHVQRAFFLPFSRDPIKANCAAFPVEGASLVEPLDLTFGGFAHNWCFLRQSHFHAR